MSMVWYLAVQLMSYQPHTVFFSHNKSAGLSAAEIWDNGYVSNQIGAHQP